MFPSESSSPQTLRIIDASLNRAAEGLRFLEDSARFLLNDVTLTEQLKTMRHTLITSGWSFQKQLIQSRDSGGDVGASIDVEQGGKDLPLAIVANSRRVQEALRTLEELAKLAGEALPVSAEKFQQARFDLYTIEKNLIARLLRQDKSKHIIGLYAVVDTDALKGRSHLDIARQVIFGGAGTVQLRDKTTEKRALLAVAQELQNLCVENGTLFIVNDYLDIALAAGADGLHIGQEDLPVSIARKLAPMDMLIGCSVFTAEQAQKAVADGADYVAVGAVFPTPSKDTVVTGLEELLRVRQAVSVPLVAIGGLTLENIAEVKKAGADSVAVIGAILGADSPGTAAREIIKAFEG
ncbi:MAG: thiamine phosphate synthase [Chloroflexi bacterium]|nr:thiamine phosphate synthase [Chloroflexota bacterium]